MPPETVSVTELPGQTEPEAGLIDPDGAELAVMTELFEAGPEQLPLNIVAV